MTRPRSGMLALFVALVAACGGSADPPAQSPAPVASAAPSASADDATAKSAELAQARARQLGAAAAAWRRGHAGTCPAVKDVLDTYTLPPGAELDASGAPFTIQCGDADVRVLASTREVVDTQPYFAAVATPPSDPLPGSPGGTEASVPVPNADAVVRSMLFPRARACYQASLKNDPNQSGVLHGRIYLNADGSVRTIVVNKKTTTLTDPALIQCLTNAMKSAYVPAPGVAGSIEF